MTDCNFMRRTAYFGRMVSGTSPYIGEIEFRGQWYPGKHQPLVDRATGDRVLALLGWQSISATPSPTPAT